MKHTRKGSETRSSSKAMLTCGGGCVQGALLDFTKGGSSATAGATGRGQRFHISVNTHTRDCLIFSWRASTFPADSWQIAGVFQTGGHHGSSVSLTAGEADELAAMTGSSLQVRRHCPPTVFPPPCLPEECAFPGPFAAVSPPFLAGRCSGWQSCWRPRPTPTATPSAVSSRRTKSRSRKLHARR